MDDENCKKVFGRFIIHGLTNTSQITIQIFIINREIILQHVMKKAKFYYENEGNAQNRGIS